MNKFDWDWKRLLNIRNDINNYVSTDKKQFKKCPKCGLCRYEYEGSIFRIEHGYNRPSFAYGEVIALYESCPKKHKKNNKRQKTWHEKIHNKGGL